MADLQIFMNEDFGTVRTALIDGEVWFVGKDVAEALGYKNTRVAIQDNVDEEDKGVTKVTTSGGIQDAIIVNESGLYALVFGSRLPSAKGFKHWVTSEVLPTIRKSGNYKVDSYQIEDPAERARRWIEEYQEKKVLESQVAVLQPKASYYDIVLNSPSLISTTTIAKQYGWSATKLNKFLNNLGIQYKLGNSWVLYQQFADFGYTGPKIHLHPAPDGTMHTSNHTYWTEKGRQFIYEVLKEHGILPQNERSTVCPIFELPDYIGGTDV